MSKHIKRKGDSMVRDTLIIFAITIVAGLLLGGVFSLTKAPIEKASQDAKNESYQLVMPEAKTFEEDGNLTKSMKQAKLDGCVFNEIVRAKDEAGNAAGYAILVTSKEGYGGDIQFSLGVSTDGVLQGVEIISMSETAGLGARCTEDEFKNQFKGISAGEVKLVKGDKSGDDQISAISGATITSTAITKAVNQALAFISQIKEG